MIIEKGVLLLKSQRGERTDKYEELLTSHGYKVEQVKTLVFEYRNLDELKQKLDNSDEYSGILFSSPRCVHATYLSLAESNIMDKWLDKWNFAVGEETRKEALNKVGLHCRGSESGNAVNLAKLILESK